MVVESRLKYQPVVFIFLSVLTLVVSGCGGDSTPKTTDQAISQAVSQLEIFGNSRTVTLWGHEEAVLPAGSLGKSAQQDVQQIGEQQKKDFSQSLAQLKTFADEPVKDNRKAKTSAFAKWLVAAMELYQGQMAVDQANLLEARQVNLKDQVLVSCLAFGQIKEQQANISPANYESAINQSQNVIAQLKKVLEVTRAQLAKVDSAIKGLNGELAEAEKQRDALNVEVGKLAAKLTSVPARQAVEVQRQINALEAKRFAVLVSIEKYQSGPLSLPEKYQVEVGDRKLTDVRGLTQMEAEKAFLATRVSKAEEGIEAQDAYRKNLQQQMAIAGQKGQQLAKELDELDGRMKVELEGLSQMVSQRAALRDQADKALKSAVRYAQQSENDLKQYIAAVSQAESGLSGRDDPYLKEVKAVDDLAYSIGNIRVNAQLTLARLQADEIGFVEQMSSILSQCQAQASLPSNLDALVKEGQADLTTKKKELAETVESVISKYESLYKGSARSSFKPMVGTQLGLAFYKASSLVPEKSEEYLAKAKEVLGQVVGEGEAGVADSNLVPARKLQRVLGQ
jgi:hypothetical protein